MKKNGLYALERRFELEPYLRQVDADLKIHGDNASLTHPGCEKTGKLWVLLHDKADGSRKAGVWQCFICDESGTSVLSLVKFIEDCDTWHAWEVISSFQTERRTTDLRQLVESTLDGLDDKPAVVAPRAKRVPLPVEFQPYVTAKRKPKYFMTRGITDAVASRYSLGFCTSGRYANRLIVPVTRGSRVQFFVARYMRKKPPPGVKKTLYPRGCSPGRVLFNYARARHGARIILVEDVFSAMHIGREAVATFGTSLSTHQLELLLRTDASELVIAWDGDAIVKAHKLAERLAEFWSVRVLELDPDGRNDPDDYSMEELEALMRTAPVLDPRGAFRATVEARLAR